MKSVTRIKGILKIPILDYEVMENEKE